VSDRVRIHYKRLPDHEQIFEQRVILRRDEVIVTLSQPLDLAKPMVSETGHVMLETGSLALWFTFPGVWHDIGRFHSADGSFRGFYANVLTPPTFHPGGIVKADLPAYEGTHRSLALQGNGGILLAGFVNLWDVAYVMRFLPDGLRDSEFGQYGFAAFDAYPTDIFTAVRVVTEPVYHRKYVGFYDGSESQHAIARLDLSGFIDYEYLALAAAKDPEAVETIVAPIVAGARLNSGLPGEMASVGYPIGDEHYAAAREKLVRIHFLVFHL